MHESNPTFLFYRDSQCEATATELEAAYQGDTPENSLSEAGHLLGLWWNRSYSEELQEEAHWGHTCCSQP